MTGTSVEQPAAGLTSSKAVLVLDALDHVAVALRDLAAGEQVDLGAGTVTVVDAIPAGHKVATRAVDPGTAVLKYGTPIGAASAAIPAGAHVHTHNLAPVVSERPGGTTQEATTTLPASLLDASFEGFRRSTGRVGTRNYIGVLTTVNCSATPARLAARRLNDELATGPSATASGGSVDGVVALTQRSGCAIGDASLDILRRTLTGYADHPNFGGVVVLGLGCETNQVGDLRALIEARDDRPVTFLNIQDLGGTASTVDAMVAAVEAMLPVVSAARRERVPAGALVLGNECGGSDGYSGITANPVMGRAGDLIAALGGSFAFGETPEIHGAEHLLIARARAASVVARLQATLGWWADYLTRAGGELDNNPSPGNKAGGITTIYEKSLGAMAKGGRSAPLNAVLGYAEPITEPGLSFMDTPGYDPVSVTGLIAGGANVVCFSTGRGSVFGSKPVPSIKVSTNSALAARMPDDIDFDAGVVVGTDTTVEAAAESLLHRILAVASGRPTCSEVLGFGDEEYVPWDVGPTL